MLLRTLIRADTFTVKMADWYTVNLMCGRKYYPNCNVNGVYSALKNSPCI